LQLEETQAATTVLANSQFEYMSSLASQITAESAAQIQNVSSQYCKVVEQILGDSNALKTQLVESGMNANCDMYCVSDCQTRQGATPQCLLECGCTGTPGAEFVFKYSPWASKPNTTAFGFGQAWTCEGQGCQWNWQYRPKISIPAAPQGPVSCPETTCISNDSYQNVLFERTQLIRAVAIAASEWARLHLLQVPPDLFYDIVQENTISVTEKHVLVSFNFNSQGLLVKVERIQGLAHNFQVTFIQNQKIFTFFVAAQPYLANDFIVALLNGTSFQNVLTTHVVLKQNAAVLTGYQYFVKAANVTQGLQKSIEVFIDTWANIILIQEQLLSAVVSAAQYEYALVLKWRVEVLDFNNKESKVTVIGYVDGLLGEIVKANYTAYVKNLQGVAGGYQVSLGTET